jgi:hypothetical protein
LSEKSRVGSKSQRTRQYVSILNRLETPPAGKR